ncbi:MAG: hypothetical protein ABEJ87_03345 [Candidatus Nanohalobium sp.]
MKELLKQLNQIQEVKSVKKRSGPVLKIDIFSREVPGREAEKIPGDLRKTSQQIRNNLEKAKENSEIKAWNWIQKPEKKYRDRAKKAENISDRQSIGYRPAYYTVSIQKDS